AVERAVFHVTRRIQPSEAIEAGRHEMNAVPPGALRTPLAGSAGHFADLPDNPAVELEKRRGFALADKNVMRRRGDERDVGIGKVQRNVRARLERGEAM